MAENSGSNSPKTEGELEPERVKFEGLEVKKEEEDLATQSPKRDGAASTQSPATSFDGNTSISWAQRADAASASMSSYVPSPTRPRPGTTAAQQQEQHQPVEQPRANNDGGTKAQSLPERLGNSALSSTLEIIKLAGGVTLSTTGTILSPSLEITRNVLLPNLFAGIVDYVGQVSPQRLKDWFRILSASVHHIIAVIVATKRGSIFRHKILRVGGDLVDVVSSDTSRQALMDGMACFIKLQEALHTPEFKAFLEHISVLGCRLVDVAAMGKNKTLIHDVLDLVWSGIELTNDPATTVAFAKVSAYLCHALEMEDAAIHAIAKQREEINLKAAQKRRERDQYQTATYREPYLFRDPNATVEEVILSAFGVIQKSVEDAKLREQLDNGDDIPGSVVLGSEDGEESERPSRAVTPTPDAASAADVKSKAATAPDGYEDLTNNSAAEPATTGEIENHKIDVGFLRDMVTKRAEATKKEQRRVRAADAAAVGRKNNKCVSNITDDSDDGKKDIEELASMAKAQPPLIKRTNPLQFETTGSQNSSDYGEEPKEEDSTGNEVKDQPSQAPDRSAPLEGEAPVAHFYRVLDQVLTNQRKQVVDSVVAKKTGPLVNSNTPEGEEEVASSSLKKHVQEHRSEKRRSARKSNIPPEIEKFINEHEMLVCGIVLGAMFLVLMFCWFGLYGMYMFVFPPKLNNNVVAGRQAFVGSGIHVPVIIHDGDDSQHKNEYVIRIIREVVHVDAKGNTLKVEAHHSDEL